jgi:hypothetical protein
MAERVVTSRESSSSSRSSIDPAALASGDAAEFTPLRGVPGCGPADEASLPGSSVASASAPVNDPLLSSEPLRDDGARLLIHRSRSSIRLPTYLGKRIFAEGVSDSGFFSHWNRTRNMLAKLTFKTNANKEGQ